jgi:type II secretory pathway pseudopilin PulG
MRKWIVDSGQWLVKLPPACPEEHTVVFRSAKERPFAERKAALVPHPSSRSGITLLEVLIAMGVIAVGVLGAASLLPIATYFQNETTKFDRGGALAQQAVHDLQIKNYLSPRRWIFIDPSNPNASNVASWLGIADLFSVNNVTNNPAVYNPFSAFALDPLGFSYVASQNPAVTFPCYFPAFPSQLPNAPGAVAGTPNPPTIYRTGITANDYWPPAATIPLTSPIIMSFPVADRMMRSNDDLDFGLPTNTDLRPTAIPFANAATGVTAQTASGTYAPNFAGDFSWIATVSRPPSDMIKGPAIAAGLHRFQVSVVVLQKRDLSLWTGPGGINSEEPPPERQVYAMFTQYAGQTGQITAPFYGGGGLQLYVYEGAAPVPAGQPTRHWLDNIKANTYLMLSANFQNNVGVGNFYPVLAWYRIINVDDGPNQDPNFNGNGTRWYRNLTVAGGDWPATWYQWPPPPLAGATLQNWQGADPNAPNAIIPLNSGTAVNPTWVPIAFCTLMDDAVAEFDDTIMLDNSLVRQ